MTTRLSTTTLIAFFATTIVLLAGVYALNTIVDPAGLRTIEAVDTLARKQRDDQTLVAPTGLDQRAWVRGRLAVANRCDVVVLGSSTLGMIDATMTTRPLLNAWLTQPTVEDFEVLVGMLERAHCRPSLIVIGIDPWLVNPLVQGQRWRVFAHDGRFAARLRAIWDTVRERLNVATTERSIEIVRRITLRPPYLVTDWEAECPGLSAKSEMRAGDGHYVRCKQHELAPEMVLQIATTYVARDFHRMQSWRAIDRTRVDRLAASFRRFAAIAPVAIVAPPYHPATYATLPRPLLDELDGVLAALAAESHSTFHALRDPALLGCTEFADGHHMLPACARRLAARVLP